MVWPSSCLSSPLWALYASRRCSSRTHTPAASTSPRRGPFHFLFHLFLYCCCEMLLSTYLSSETISTFGVLYMALVVVVA